jgi:co-chaperonin GroES (HSP10)
MKYMPKPNCAIIQLIDEPEKTTTPSGLILPNQKPTKFYAKVVRVGYDMEFVAMDDVILYDKYHAKCIDENEKIYSISLDGIICIVEEDRE